VRKAQLPRGTKKRAPAAERRQENRDRGLAPPPVAPGYLTGYRRWSAVYDRRIVRATQQRHYVRTRARKRNPSPMSVGHGRRDSA